MYYVYILQDTLGKFYIGYSANLRKRISDHIRSHVFTTKRMDEPKLIYYEAYGTSIAAKTREKKLKQFGSSYNGLIKRLNLVKYKNDLGS